VIDQERTQGLFRRLDILLSRTGAAPTPERVHQVRTTARRLEAILEIVYPEATSRVARTLRGLKRLRRRAGAVRDLDVQAAALRTLKIGRETERKARLLSTLADARAAKEAQFQKAIHHKKVEKLQKRLQQTALEMAQASVPPEQNGQNWPPVWIDFDPVSASLRMFARLARQTKAITADNIHLFRTRCKRVRYVGEMAGMSPESKRVVGLLKRVQDSIGDWHDWQTLTLTAEDLFSRSLDSALVSALRNISNAKFVEARAVATDARRELMRDYRTMLAREREKRQAAVLLSTNGQKPTIPTARKRKPAPAVRRKPASPASSEKTTAGVA
jgi:CHAD domain-containing protein